MSHQRDLFIAHAFHDKDAYVRPLATALGRRAVSCWIDDAQIGPGDSLVDAMNLGLRTSRYVAVVITERFLASNWAPRELNAALQLEVRQGETKVLPIVAVPTEELEAYPLLLDKRWLAWSEGPEGIAEEIAKLFSRSAASDWHVDPPESYVGRFWARAVAGPTGMGQPHSFTFRWGPYIRRAAVDALGPEPLSMLFHKTNPDRVTLHVETAPAAILTFGIGDPPDANPTAIDEGWERSAGWNFPQEKAAEGKPGEEREKLTVRSEGRPSERDAPAVGNCFHVRVSRYVFGAEAFNLTAEEMSERFLTPWLKGRPIFLKGRRWDPSKSRISVYQGLRLTSQQRSLGLGWSKAVEFGEDVTEDLLQGRLIRLS
ncbi:MAG TPA: toll/interleukin-1 receptor domain-containing protein [Solirubrobacterales bacterium]|nr:toll/interleukin-1 receptor domain-containing protein [Solirubrobacterales bacterium]